MAYDEILADRLRDCFAGQKDIAEKKMFGGLAIMLSGNMCCGVTDDRLMARVGPDHYQEALARPHASEMDFTGKPLKGFVYVAAEGIATGKALREWVDLCEAFVGSLPSK